MLKRNKKKIEEQNTLVVGVGASAGGLEPLQEFFRSLPEETGIAFIVVFHLSPDRDSNLTEILQREPSLDMEQVPEEAKYSSMPNGVIQSGAVDKVLSVKDMVKELLEYRETLSKLQIAEEAGELSKEEKTYAQI